MRANGEKPPIEKILLLVSMATLTVAVMAVKVDVDANQNQTKNETENSTKVGIGISVNETAGNLTLDFNPGDLAFEQEKTRHELVLMDDDGYNGFASTRKVECRGENIKSFGAISCDSMESCEEKKSLLFGQSKCRRWSSSNHKCWRECGESESGRNTYFYIPRYGFSLDSSEQDTNASYSCLRLEISLYSGFSGIVQCTSEEDGERVTSFDHYTIGYYNATFLSAFKNVTSDLIKMKLYVASLTEPVNANSDYSLIQGEQKVKANSNANVTLFVDEEVTSLECQVPNLLFHNNGPIIRVHWKDGSTLKLDSKMSTRYSDGYLKAELTGFRVSKDVVAFSCSVQKTNSSGEWLENRVNVTVQELPSELFVKTSESESRSMSVNLTSGSKVNLKCELTGQLLSIQNQMRKVRYNFGSAVSSNSVIEFLRFYQVAGERLICQNLDSDELNSATGRHNYFGYGYQQPFGFIFNLAPSAPKIHRPNPNHPNPTASSSSVYLIYNEDHVVDQTLLCLFNGDPEPVITWMKNGQEFLKMKSMGIRHQGNERLEHVKLPLDSKTIQPSDFYLGENGNGSVHVNFSCVMSNFFGSDRLDFIIMRIGGFGNHFQNSNTTTTSTTENTPTLTTTETTKIFRSSATTISASTSTFQTRATPNLDSSSNSTLNLEKRGGAEKSKLVLIVTCFFVLSFILILGFSILWKKRAAFARVVESRRIFTFRNLVQNERSESMQTVLAY